MTAQNPVIDPALRALGHAQRDIADAINAHVLANVNSEWEKTLLTNDRLLILIGTLVRDAARYRALRSEHYAFDSYGLHWEPRYASLGKRKEFPREDIKEFARRLDAAIDSRCGLKAAYD